MHTVTRRRQDMQHYDGVSPGGYMAVDLSPSRRRELACRRRAVGQGDQVDDDEAEARPPPAGTAGGLIKARAKSGPCVSKKDSVVLCRKPEWRQSVRLRKYHSKPVSNVKSADVPEVASP